MDTLDLGLLVLRLGVGLTFAAHGAQKVLGWWGGPGIAGWSGAMGKMGFNPPRLFAWLSALVELVGGLFLAAGLLTPIAAVLLLAQSVVIIAHVHWTKGFFNSGGGYEFPLALAVATIAVLLMGPGAFSIDGALGYDVAQRTRVVLVALGVIAGVVALAVPRLGSINLSGNLGR